MSQSRSDQAEVSVYPIFVALYVTGFMMEMVERWLYPGWTAAGVVLSLLTIVLAKQRIVFLVFLVLTTAYFLLFRFPEVANHINLLIFCNVLLILGLAYSYLSRRGREDFPAYFEALLSPVRLMLIVTYSVAGFHKLNHDFLNPEVSCIRSFLRTFRWTLTRPLFDEGLLFLVPTVAFIVVIGLLVLWLALRRGTGRFPRWPFLCWLAAMCLAGALVASSASAAEGETLGRHVGFLILGIAGLIVFWQLIEGPLLLVPWLQPFILCFALVVHSYLGLIGFVDFQSIALALILAFVPRPVVQAWGRERRLQLGALGVDRVHAYVGLNLLAGLLTAFHVFVTPLFEPPSVKAMQGILFNGGVLILLWPLLVGLLRGTRDWRWRGVSVFDRRTPKFLYLLPVLLVLFGLTSHFGLRTAGNFSMFSNLRTEGDVSNHLLFKNNPLKFWDYQEDVVHVIELDDAAARAGHHYMDLQGLKLPVVEFRKLVDTWAKEAMVVPIVFEYQGQLHTSDNIAADPAWRPESWDWEMILLDFRVIQPEGPNECRW